MTNILKISLLCLLMAACFYFVQTASAQQPKKSSTSPAAATPKKVVESELRKLTTTFVETYGKFTQTKDKAAVLKFMYEKVSASLFNANISGKYRVFSGDYQAFDEYLTKLANAENLNLVYKLTGIAAEYTSDDIGSVVYTADYQMEREGSVWEKGIEQVTLVFKKFGNDWKIVYYNTINIEDEKLRGDCFCELFESKPGNFVAKTTVPGGRGYNEDLQTFEFLQKPEGRVIRSGNQVYLWAESGEISYTPQRDAKTNPTTISPAAITLSKAVADKEQAIMLILQEVNYKESCANIKMRRK
ncbi:MAG: hypothetical protein RMJ87_10635 [Cytophagales bacterium]|nr:hypothetical protein [Bernardetiaceae bacterium]MDW8205475.1 hypothetical protein [Cytophagales bacterium]